MNTERERLSAQFINQSFVRKLDEGRVKEAADEGSRFIRSKLRQESFAREILQPIELSPDEIDRDEHTDQPKKIIEKEPDSTATFVTFKGSGQRTFFRGPRYSVFFGKVESQHFMKSKFELLTYQNDIRKILTDNSVKDMADVEDQKFIETIEAALSDAAYSTNEDTLGGAVANGDAVRSHGGVEFLGSGLAVDATTQTSIPDGTSLQFSGAQLLRGNNFQAAVAHCADAATVDAIPDAARAPLSKELIAQLFQAMTAKKLPIGKMLMSKTTFMEALKFDHTEVGNDIVSRHYDNGLEGEDKLFGVPVITTIKNDIIPDNVIYLFAPENYLGNFFLLQDATLFIKQEADMIEFWSYSSPGIGIGNTKGVIKLSGFKSVGA
tara:strand:- start:5219 stop:6358 length:1140 start_codon:yes stop_codon:yes gene_type:complete